MVCKSHILALSILIASSSWAAAASDIPEGVSEPPLVELGTLSCSIIGEREGAGAAGAGIGRAVLCRFQPGDTGPVETYTGSLQGVGRSDLLFGKGAMLLLVKGHPSVKVMPGMLAQTYGADAAASGSAAAPLVGDKNKKIVLQPLIEGLGRVTEGKSQPEAVIIMVELALQATPA